VVFNWRKAQVKSPVWFKKEMRCVGLELGTMAFGNGHPLV